MPGDQNLPEAALRLAPLLLLPLPLLLLPLAPLPPDAGSADLLLIEVHLQVSWQQRA
jgi:hypothetical protein